MRNQAAQQWVAHLPKNEVSVVSSQTLPPPLRTAGRITAWLAAGFLLVLVAISAWVGIRGAMAYQQLSQIQGGVSETTTAVASDPSAAAPALARLASQAQTAHDLTSDPIWSFAEGTPWIGPQLAAFATIAAASDELLRESLLPLVTAAQDTSIDTLKPVDGRIDTSSLGSLSAPARTAADAASRAAAAVADINRTPLIGAVGTAVDQADELFSRSSSALDALARTTQLLPAMLGQDGPRNYLLLVQNNAEWRSLGGITGTAILMRTDHGAISLGDTRSATELSRGLTEPVTRLSDEIQNIYQNRPARYFHNLTQIPDFTVDGPLARDMYRKQTGTEVDGVIAVDPVVLSYLLKATGPVPLSDGESLTSENAVSVLLNEVYARYPQASAQDAFFAGATGAVFQAFLKGQGSTPGILTALVRSTDERRVFMWAANPEEQALLDGTALAGGLPETTDQTARFGVYLNDGTGSKMSYYVKPTATLVWGHCATDGPANSRQLTLTVTLTNSAPADAASALPSYVTGNGAFGVAPGSASVVPNVYLPQGYTLVSTTTSDGTSFLPGTYEGRDVLTYGFTVPPQSSASFTVIVQAVTSAAQAEAIVTPTADSSLDPTVVADCKNAATATLE